nr:hypothetical protein [Tanacetum cinerariifolium]
AKSGYGPGDSPVYLNVYDLTPMNGYAYLAGLGIFHSGVQGKQIPRWVNRLAKLGNISLCYTFVCSMVSCVLPEALRVSAVQRDP